MPDATLIILTGGGLVLGAAAAQLRGPTFWNWEGRAGDLQRRLSCLPRRAPPRARRVAGVALLAALLTGGGLTAYAAQPSKPDAPVPQAIVSLPAAPIRLAAATPAAPAVRTSPATGPDALPAQVAGVVGSGSELALQLKPVDAAAARTLKIGDTYEDGWILSGLDASTATLTKAGVSRTVGLNPTGALSRSPAPMGGATVTVNPPTSPEAVADAARAELDRATAAARAATPETRPALEAAANAAAQAAVKASNDIVQAWVRNNALRAQQGLPPSPLPILPPVQMPFPRPPVLSGPVPSLPDAQAAAAAAQAELTRAMAAQRAATPETQRALDAAANDARLASIAAQNALLAAQNAQQAGQ